MRVRLRTTYAGARGTARPGEIVDLPKVEAEALVAGGYAAALKGKEGAVERAVIGQPEAAIAPAQARSS
jgi:hypothetical protein